MNESFPNKKRADAADADNFPTRLKEAIGNNSIRGFARNCGFSDTVLRQYLSGQSEPTRPALLAIARAAEVSLEWLATGQMSSKESAELLATQYVYKEPLAFKSDWLQQEFPNSFENLLLTHVPDESMEPTLKAGDIVLVDTNDRDVETISHGIYLIKLNNRIFIKRLQYVADDTLRILSEHPAYEAFSILLSGKPTLLSVMGRIVWFSHKL